MKLKLAAAVLPLALGGCLPLPITIASTAFSGVSYLTSGKSTTDHVLSATMHQDCALTRPVVGEPICRDIGPGGEGRTNAVTVAFYPGDRDDGSSDERRLATRSRGALNLSALDEEARQVAAAPQFLAQPPRVSVAGIIVTKDQIVPGPGTRPLPVSAENSWALVPSRTIDVAPLAAPAAAAPSALPPAASRQVAAVPPAPAAPLPAARAQTRAVTPADGADRWVVLGSFRSIDRAKALAGRFADRNPAIVAASVEGGQWHRVAIGPLTPDAARTVRDGLGRVDGRQPWVFRDAAR